MRPIGRLTIFTRSAPTGLLVNSTVITLGAAAAVGFMVGVGPSIMPSALAPSYDQTVSGCTVTDGDTIRCGGERVRLLGIDAPELPGHCNANRVCAPGDPYASTASLEAALVGNLRIQRVGEDRYGRTLAIVSGAKGDLSCWQLSHGQAIYKPKWDNGYRVARLCPRSAL